MSTSSVRIPDPEVSPSTMTITTTEIQLPDEWRERMRSGVNFRVELILHVDGAVQTPTEAAKWRARWLSVA